MPHPCPAGCGRRVPDHLFACRTDWYRLLADLRRPIGVNYQRDPDAHAEAMADAVRWYAEQKAGER